MPKEYRFDTWPEQLGPFDREEHLPEADEAYSGVGQEWVPELATTADYDTHEIVVLPDNPVIPTASADVTHEPLTDLEVSDLRDRRFDAILPIPDSRFQDY